MAEFKDGGTIDGPKLENYFASSAAKDEKPQISAWDRVKILYYSRDSDLYSNAPQAVGMGSITGFLIGGRIGARLSGTEHITGHQLTVYSSKIQAHREYHSAVVKGFVRNGCSAVFTTLQEYRDKEDVINYIATGAVTGATYKLFSGFRGIVVGTVLGSSFSIPVAMVAQGFMLLLPRDIKEKYRESKAESKCKQTEEWLLGKNNAINNEKKSGDLVTNWESKS
eukprot:gene6068-6770_t